MKFGDKVKSLRKLRDMSAMELAKQAGLSQPFISDIEAGRRANPTADTLEKLSRALRVEPSYFIDDTKVSPLELMPDMPAELKKFIADKDSLPWISLSKEAAEKGLSPESVKKVINTIMELYGEK